MSEEVNPYDGAAIIDAWQRFVIKRENEEAVWVVDLTEAFLTFSEITEETKGEPYRKRLEKFKEYIEKSNGPPVTLGEADRLAAECWRLWELKKKEERAAIESMRT